MAKPIIIANGGTPGVKASVAAGSTVTFTLDSLVGVRSVRWSMRSTDETTSVENYTIAQSGSIGQNASVTALGIATAATVDVQVNGGLVRERPDLENTTNTIKFFVPTSNGLEVGVAGETYESDSTFGTTEILNAPIRLLNGLTLSLYENDLKRATASSIVNVALTGNPSPMDGQTIVTGDVVLLLGQSTTHQNGLWEVDTAGAWARPSNFATTDAVQGSSIAVVKGTVRTGYFYQNTNTNSPTIGTTALTFVRLPDRFDRADLAAASASPSATILTRYGSASELNAAFLSSNGTNPAGVGFIRTIANAVGLAFRNAANSADLQAVSMDATDTIRVGSSLVQNVIAAVRTAGEIQFVDNAATFIRHALAGTIFGSTATMSFTQTTRAGNAGTAATIEAQAGDTGFAGAALTIASGTAGAGSTPGTITFNSKASSTASGRVSFVGGGFGEFVGMVYNDSTTRTTVEISGDIASFDTKVLELDSTNLSVFVSPGSYGSGTRMIFIGNTALPPSANPVGGGLLWCEDGALRFRGPGGTTTTIAIS